MARPRNHSLRFCGEISIRNYLHRQHTTIIKITVVVSATNALICRRLISYRTTTASVGQQKLSQGFWEQGKALKCIFQHIQRSQALNSSDSGRGNTALALATIWSKHQKAHAFSFFYYSVTKQCVLLHPASSLNFTFDLNPDQSVPLAYTHRDRSLPSELSFVTHSESSHAYCKILLILSNKIYLFIP